MTTCPEIPYHWWYFHFPVGVCSAFAALVKFLYSLIKEPSQRIKLMWSAAVFLLIGAELYSIVQDRNQNNRDQSDIQCKERQQFEGIAGKLEKDIATNQQNFSVTMGKVDRVTELATTNLNNLKGGKSFAYVTPFVGINNGKSGSITVNNAGNELLTDVEIELGREIYPCEVTGAAADTNCRGRLDDASAKNYPAGSVAAHSFKQLPNAVIQYDPLGTGGSAWHFDIYAQNGRVIEELYFRRDPSGRGYQYKFIVITFVTGKPQKGDYKLENHWARVLARADWSRNESPTVATPK
jgi:hypothetical protein